MKGDEAVLAKVRELGDQWTVLRLPWAMPGEEDEARPAAHAVTVRCLVAEDGSVPDGDSAPGNVAVVACAYWGSALPAGERPKRLLRIRGPHSPRCADTVYTPGRISDYVPA